MDIKHAKQEIEHAVKAYLAVDDTGTPLIPPIRQRPILLMGPPGVGKTQIMEQIAQECGIALVAYTCLLYTSRAGCRGRNDAGTDRSSPQPPPVQGPVSYTHLDVYKRQL